MTADPESLNDEELARNSQAGSFAAFEELVRRFETRIYAFLFQCCGNATDARDLTQDTFVRAYQALAQFDSRHSFAPWLFTIARRKSIDLYRSRKPFVNEAAPDVVDFNDPSELMAQNEDAENIWNVARRALPAVQFQALWLQYVEEMNVAQIAAALGRTQTHVKVILWRARHALANKLPRPARAPETPRTTHPAMAKGGSL